MHFFWFISGLVLSLLLYTHDCKSYHETRFLIKISAVVILLFGEQNGHGPFVSNFVNWYDESYLWLIVSKTKTLSTYSNQHQPNVIHNETVKCVDHYKHLGATVDLNLNIVHTLWHYLQKEPTMTAFSKKLRSLDVDKTILTLFYRSECSHLLNHMLVWQSKCVRQKQTSKIS